MLVVGEEGYDRKIDIAIEVEIARHGLVSPVEMEEPGFAELKRPRGEIDPDAMERLGRRGVEIGIVSVGDEQIHPAVAIDVSQFEPGVPPAGVALEYQM